MNETIDVMGEDLVSIGRCSGFTTSPSASYIIIIRFFFRIGHVAGQRSGARLSHEAHCIEQHHSQLIPFNLSITFSDRCFVANALEAKCLWANLQTPSGFLVINPPSLLLQHGVA